MSIGENKHIEGLLKRFFEGQTSNDEEQRLYEFFAGNDVPEHLIQYKPVFVYFDEGIKDEFSKNVTEEPVVLLSQIDDIEKDTFIAETFSENSTVSLSSRIDSELREKDIPVHRKRNVKWIFWSCAAAVLLVLILLNPFALGNKPFDPYEGSYIVRNGVRITDPETIRPELEATIQDVLQQQEAAESLIAKMMEAEKPAFNGEEFQKASYNTILEGFVDENIRNEVKKILEQE